MARLIACFFYFAMDKFSDSQFLGVDYCHVIFCLKILLALFQSLASALLAIQWCLSFKESLGYFLYVFFQHIDFFCFRELMESQRPNSTYTDETFLENFILQIGSDLVPMFYMMELDSTLQICR